MSWTRKGWIILKVLSLISSISTPIYIFGATFISEFEIFISVAQIINYRIHDCHDLFNDNIIISIGQYDASISVIDSFVYLMFNKMPI